MTQARLDESRFYLRRDSRDIETWSFAGGIACVYSCKNPQKSTFNEDAVGLILAGDSSGVIAVADGCGGMHGGDQAAELAVKQISKNVQNRDTSSNLRTAILDGMEIANGKVIGLGIGAATTLAVLEIDSHVVRSYHVGDSGILMTGNRGKIKLATQSHSPVGYAVQAGVINESDAMHHEDRHIVSNVIGDANTHIEIGSQRQMALRDTILVASDGLFDNCHNEEIVETCRKGPLESAIKTLAATATERMQSPTAPHPSKPDDLTIVLFRRNPI